jgi:PAS domain S-box-containing protein
MSKAGEIQSVRQWNLSVWQRTVLFGVAFVVCAEIGNYLSPDKGKFLTLWLPAGLYLAVLLRSEYREWPWLALGALCGNFVFDLLYGTKAGIICFFYAANTAQAMTGAWLIRRFISKYPMLTTLKEFAGLVLFAGVIGTVLGAFIGVETLVRFGLSHTFGQSFKTWWGGNATAILMLAPFILAWIAKPLRPFFGSRRKIVEAVLLFAGLNTGIWYLLALDNGVMSPNKSVVIPFLLWAGLRFGVRGATVTNLYLALGLTFFTVQFHSGLTPAQVASGEYVFVLQLVLVTGAVISLIPAIIIGERDRSLAELRESEERFRNLTRASAEGICVSEHGRILDVNDQFIALVGYSREELIGREIVTLVAPEWRERTAERLRTGEEGLMEHQILRKDGTVVDVEARAKTSAWENRMVRITALSDISERRHSAAALQASESRFRTLIEQAPVAVSISRAGKTIYVNQKYLDAFGYQRMDELVGRPIFEQWAPEFRPVIEERVRLREEGKPVPSEYEGRAQRKDGSKFPAYLTVAAVSLPDGPAWLAFITDITARKQAEQALRESEEKFSKAFRASPNGMSISEIDTGRFVEINDGYCQIYGYRREEMLDHTALELQIWEDPRERARFVEELKKAGMVRNYEARTRTRAGELKLILLSAEPIEVAGRSCLVSVLHDITDRKQAELEKEAAIAREQKARLEYTLQLIASQEAERTRIAAELHDGLGQNLLLIKNRAQLALMKERIDADMEEQIEAISSLAAQSIAEARGISHDLHPYQLDHLGLTRALKAMVDKADESSGVIFKRKFDDVDDVFTKDAALNLYRTVQESLNNILKHSRAKKARILLERDVHEVQLTIEDDGCGFDPAKTGKGMGLKNIAERARMLGGELKLDSAPGHGARIEIMIPIYAEAE